MYTTLLAVLNRRTGFVGFALLPANNQTPSLPLDIAVVEVILELTLWNGRSPIITAVSDVSENSKMFPCLPLKMKMVPLMEMPAALITGDGSSAGSRNVRFVSLSNL
jgi:hypothetical protein